MFMMSAKFTHIDNNEVLRCFLLLRSVLSQNYHTVGQLLLLYVVCIFL